MSRSTVSKSRADKAKDKDKDRGGSTSVPAPPVNTDVIPGRFTENDWNSILDKEDGEEFVVDIVKDIVDSTINVIYNNYIEKQLYPYVVQKSRDLFLHIIEWQFLARDEGEANPVEDKTWAEEEEPFPNEPDAWAQGSVPQHPLPPVSPVLSEHDTEVTSISRVSNPEILEDLPSTFNETVTNEEAEQTERSQENAIQEEKEDDKEEEKNNEEEIVEEKKEPLKPRKPKYKPYRGPIKSAGVRSINKPLEETERELMEAEMRAMGMETPMKKSALDYMPSSCHNILKVQTGRPPGSKEVTYDDMGNVVAVVRLDPEKLPSHRVRTKFTVIDPAVEAAQARLQAMRTGRHRTSPSSRLSRGRSTQQETRSGNAVSARTDVTSVAASQSTMRKRKDEDEGGITPLPPPLIESMELSPGVTVREGNRFKQGPKLTLRTSDVTSSGKIQSLRPLVTVDTKGIPLSVGDIIGSQSPSVRPLTMNDPIPPILPRHSSSREYIVKS